MRPPRAPPPARSAPSSLAATLAVVVSATLALLPRVAHAASLDCTSQTDAAAALTPCASAPGATAECCAGLDAWDRAGCFCEGAGSVVALSQTYTALVENAAPLCPDLDRSTRAGDPHCAAVPTAPGLPAWAYAAVDAANGKLRLTWAAEGTTGATGTSTPAVAFAATHCDPGVDRAAAEAACAATTVTETVPASPDGSASSYALAIDLDPNAPAPRAFVMLTSSDAEGRTATLAGPFDVVNFDPRDPAVADRTFLSPAGSAASSVATDGARCGDFSAPCGTLEAALAAAKRRRGVADPAADASIVADVFALPGAHAESAACGVSLGGDPAAAHFHANVSVSGLPGLDPASTVFNCTGGDRGGFRVEGALAGGANTVALALARLTIAGARFPSGRGGGGFASGAGASLTATDAVFLECASGRAGGGVSVERGASSVLTRVAIDSCTGGNDLTGSDVRGGGAYAEGEGTALTLEDSVVVGCSLRATGKGGGVNADGGAALAMRSTRVEANAAFLAGGVFVGVGSVATASEGSSIRRNLATYAAGVGVFGSDEVPRGGAFLASDNVTVAENVASEWGGGLIVYYNANATLANATVARNVAKIGAGAEAYSGAALRVSDSRFVANAAGDAAGGLHLAPGATATLVRVVVEGNRAGDSGGAGGVRVGAGATLELRGGAVRGNEASGGGGGGVACEGGAIRAFGADVAENACATLGGGAFLSRGCRATFEEGSTIRANVVRGAAACGGSGATSGGGLEEVSGGGGVALAPPDDPDDGATEFILGDTSALVGNVAPVGGGVFIRAAGTLATGNRSSASATFVGDAAVRGNRATAGDGGGAYAAAGTVAFADGAVVEANDARGSGGGAFATERAALALAGAGDGSSSPSPSIVGNVAGRFGGGVAHAGARLSVSGRVRFERNTARHGGGVAIALDPAAALAAHASGAAPWPSFALTGGVAMRGNVAASRGGALFVSAPLELGAVSDVVFDDSRAIAGEHAYWTRAASPNAAFACDGCLARARSGDAFRAFEFRRVGGGGAAVQNDPPVGAATEALAATLIGSTNASLAFESGRTAPAFEAALVDHYGRVASTEDGVACRVEPRDASGAAASASNASANDADERSDFDALELAGVVRNVSVAGVVRFAALVPRGRLGSEHDVTVACERAAGDGDDGTTAAASSSSGAESAGAALPSSMDAAVAAPLAAASVAASVFRARFLACSPGHEPVFASLDASGAPVARSCAECEDRTYNFDGLACRSCPLGGDCRGGADLRSSPGWHRSSPDAEALFACPLRGACEPGNATGDAACAPGYAGPVCAVCAAGYRRWGGECAPCDGAATLALPALGLVCFVGFVVAIFRVPAGAGDGSNSRACLFSSLLFIAQCVGLLKEYDVRLPRGADRVVDALDLSNFNLGALAPGCADSGVNFYRNYVVAVATPPAIAALCALVHHGAERARRRSYRAFENRARTDMDEYEDVKLRCWRNAAWLLAVSYSGVAKSTLQMYNARRLDVGSFLRRDYGIRAETARHDRYAAFGYVALAAYPIGIPLLFAFVLHRGARTGRLDDPQFRAKFGFLYKMYKPSFAAWELAGMLTKFTLAAVPVFATESRLRGRASDDAALDYGAGGGFAAACQATVAQAALLALLVAVLWCRPHKAPTHSAQQAAAAAAVLGWVLIIGNVLNTETDEREEGTSHATPSDDADDDESPPARATSAAFTAEERLRVCSAAAVATAVAVAVMVYWSFAAGDLDDIRDAPRRASRAVKNAYGRLSSYWSVPRRKDDAKRDEGGEEASESDEENAAEVTQVEVTIRAEREAKDDEREAKDVERP